MTGPTPAPEKPAGLLPTAWKNRRDLFGWDLFAAVALGLWAWRCVPFAFLRDGATDLLQMLIGAQAALLAILIAGAAILGAAMNPRFAQLLRRSRAGIVGDFFALWWTAAVAVWAAVLDGILVVAWDDLRPGAQAPLFGIAVALNAYPALATISVFSLIVGQTVNRADFDADDDAAKNDHTSEAAP